MSELVLLNELVIKCDRMRNKIITWSYHVCFLKRLLFVHFYKTCEIKGFFNVMEYNRILNDYFMKIGNILSIFYVYFHNPIIGTILTSKWNI